MSQVGLKNNTEKTNSPQVVSRDGYTVGMIIASVIIIAMISVTTLGIFSMIEKIPGSISKMYSVLDTIVTRLFVTDISGVKQYNPGTFFVAFLFILFAGIGAVRSIYKWALWICSREKEKGPFWSWVPNFVYSKFAVEKFRLLNKDEAISELQKVNEGLQKEKDELRLYVAELANAVDVTLRDRRLAFNLDVLSGKAYSLAAASFTNADRDHSLLKLFLSDICGEICSTTFDGKNNKQASIFVRDYEKDTLVMLGSCRSGNNPYGVTEFKNGEGFVGQVWKMGHDIVYTDIQEQAADILVKEGERRYNSIVGVPLLSKREVIGVVVVASQQREEVSLADCDNIKRYINLIRLGLLIHLSPLIKKGGDQYEVLDQALQFQRQGK